MILTLIKFYKIDKNKIYIHLYTIKYYNFNISEIYKL